MSDNEPHMIGGLVWDVWVGGGCALLFSVPTEVPHFLFFGSEPGSCGTSKHNVCPDVLRRVRMRLLDPRLR